MRYAHIHYKTGESPDVGEVLETNPLAVSLFLLSLARADIYGILPGEPRRYRAAVAPAAIIQPDEIEACIAEQERRGWVRRYTDSAGNVLLHILNYHEYQAVRWQNRIAPPEHELPAWWEAPSGLVEWLNSDAVLQSRNADKWQVLRERYCTATMAATANDDALPECNGSATVALPECNGSATVALPECNGSKHAHKHKTQDTEHRTQERLTTPAPPDGDAKPAQQLAESIWAAFGQSPPCHKQVYAAAAQFQQVHGDTGCETFTRWADENVPPLDGALPEKAIPAWIRGYHSRGKRFLWDPQEQQATRGRGNRRPPRTRAPSERAKFDKTERVDVEAMLQQQDE